MKTILLILLTVGSLNCMFGSSVDRYEKRELISEEGDTLRYRVLFPENYDRSKSYPLILFLHGAGERGSDNEKQLVHGSKLFLGDNQTKYPAIVLVPQCPEDYMWTRRGKQNKRGKWVFKFPVEKEPNLILSMVIDLVDQFKAEEAVDRSRLYVMGLSMGGMGTFELSYYRPNMFAAAVPICGGHNSSSVRRYSKSSSFWLFHGAKDDVVPTDFSRKMYKKLKGKGFDVKYTEYPEANHNSWDSAFAEPQLLEWLFSKKLD